MAWYLTRRIGQSLIVLFGVSVVAFALIHLAPGDPAREALGMSFSPSLYKTLIHEDGLDKPIVLQYLLYMRGALTGNLGASFSSGQQVIPILLQRFPATASLSVTGFLIGLILAIPLGSIAAVRNNTWVDSAIRVFSQVGISIPDFWLGILLIVVLAGVFRWLPPSGYISITSDPIGWASHVAMPALAVGLVSASVFTRFVRAAVLEELRKDYVRTAQAKGLSIRAVLSRHVLRNAFVSLVTVFGLQLAYLLGGVIVIEVLFAWPGLGLLVYTAIEERDYEVLQGAILLIATMFVVVNLIVDLLYPLIDPRIVKK